MKDFLRTARAQALFEACLAAPLLLGFILWVVHCGVLSLSKTKMAIWARQAARIASTGKNPQVEVQEEVKGYPWFTEGGIRVQIRPWGWGVTAEVEGEVCPPGGEGLGGLGRYRITAIADAAKARLCWY